MLSRNPLLSYQPVTCNMCVSLLKCARCEHLAIVFIVVRWVCVSMRYTRSSGALDQRYAFVVVRCVRRDLCACTKMCAELDAFMYTTLRRTQTCAERAGQTPNTRGWPAGYALCVRQLRSSAHPACF